MSDCSDGRKKKRFTLIASLEGLEKAKKSLLRLGFESQSNFAESQRLSRSSVSNFFNRKPIQLDTFKRICEGLKLEWQDVAEIAEMAEENIAQKLKEKQKNLTSYIEMGVGAMTTLVRQIIVLDESSRTIKAEIRLSGDINSVQNIQLVASILKEYGGNTIKINDIREGSIKLIIEGSKKDINQLLLRIKSGELTEIDGFSIETTQILSRDLENKGSNKEKWRLVKSIIKNSAIKRNLGGVNLSDADLGGADLGGADLSGADLSGADLSSPNLILAIIDSNLRLTNLRGADLSGADLSSANLKFTNLSDADLSSANLGGANLGGANLSRVNLRGADLRDANLRGADLRDADLRDANLRDINLRGADLSDINLSCASLRSANLSDANVERARFSSGIEFGITEDLKQELIERGAIFEDSPGDRSSIFSGSPQSK